MSRTAFCLVTLLVFVTAALAWTGEEPAGASAKAADGVYAVRRESVNKKEVLPLKSGELLVVHNHRYVKADQKEAARFVVVSAAADVPLDLAGEPKGVKEDKEVVRILLKLRPKAAAALAKLTRAQLGRQVAIVVKGEVVTMHKVREVIQGGEVQITSCAAGAAEYLLKQLRTRQQGNGP